MSQSNVSGSLAESASETFIFFTFSCLGTAELDSVEPLITSRNFRRLTLKTRSTRDEMTTTADRHAVVSRQIARGGKG